MTKSETTATASNNSEDTLGKAFSITKEEQEFLELARGLEGGDTANFSKEFLNFILDITSDSDDIFSTKDDPKERKAHPKQRLDFLKILFLVLGLCTPDVQAEYLHTFNYKLKIAGLKVQAELSRRGGVAKVLDVLHVSSELSGTVLKEVLQLLSVLLSFDVNVHELKRILALMMGTDNPNKIASKPYFWDGLLSLLSGVSAEMRPQNYFYLSGINSGFKLPDIRFPSGGYTLSFWIRFESFSCRTTKDPMCSPCIATFGSLTGQHLSIFIRDSCVVIQHQIAPSKVETVVFKTAQLSTRKWYMLTLSHVSRIIRRSEISLYLDGVLAESNSLSYPKSDVNFCDSCIAASPARTDAQMLKVGPLWCQLGKVMLLCNALDANEVSLLYKVGPNATIKTDSVGQVDGTYMFARKAVKLLFAYHPNGFCKGVCVDIASGLSSPVSQQGVHVDRSAKAFEGVKVFHTTPLHLALLNAGGIKLLLPLFRQIEFIDTLDVSTVGGSTTKPSSNPKSQALYNLLTFVINICSTDPRHLQEMASCKFFALLSYVFTDVLSPSTWTLPCIDALNNLVDVVSVHDELLQQMFRHIYFNFKIWVRTPMEIQLDILKYLATKASEQPVFFRRVLGVQGVLDIIRTHYWFSYDENFAPAVVAYSSCLLPAAPAQEDQRSTEGDEDSNNNNNNSNSVTDIPQKRKPQHVLDEASVAQMRRLFLSLINIFCENKFTEDEIRPFFLYVHGCADSKQCTDIAKFLLDIVSAKVPQHIIHTKMLLKSGGVTPWLFVLKRGDPVLQDVSLQLICHLLLASVETTDKGVIRSWVVALKHTLQALPLRLSTFYALLGLFLGDISTSSPLPSKDDQTKSLRKLVIRFPYVLPVIFELLALSATDLQRTMLADFEYLFSALGKNLFVHISVKKWVLCLLALIPPPANQNPQCPEKSAPESSSETEPSEKLASASSNDSDTESWSAVSGTQAIQSSVISLLSNLIVQRLVTDSGTETRANIVEVFGVLRKVKEENRIANCDAFIRMLGRATLDRLTDKSYALRYARGSKSTTEAMLEWACLTCLSVFSWDEHVLVLSDRYSDSTLWSLVHFAQCLLDFIDQLVPQREDSVVAAAANALPLQLASVASANSASSAILANLGKRPITTPTGSGGDGGIREGVMTAELRDMIILRLTLLVLYETHSMVHVRKLDRKKVEIARLNTLTKRSIETGPSTDAPSQSLYVLTTYLSQKMKYWNDELLAASKSFSACTQRFMVYVKKAVTELPPDEARGKILVILSFLRDAIEKTSSPDRLREIFVKVAHFGMLLDSRDMSTPDVLLEKGFSDADRRLLGAVHEKEEETITLCYEHLAGLGTAVFREADVALTAELTAATHVSEKAAGILAKWAEDEQKRIRVPNPKALEAFWRQFVFDTWPREMLHWKLDPAESSKRMRKRFSPNLTFDRHKDKVPTSSADDDSSLKAENSNDAILKAVVGPKKESDSGDDGGNDENDDDENGVSSNAAKEIAKEGKEASANVVNDANSVTYSAELIEPLHATPIEFTINAKWVRMTPAKGVAGFIDRVAVNTSLNEVFISLVDVVQVLPRRYAHIDSALEIFTASHMSYFVFFVNPRDRNRAYRRLGSMGAAEVNMLSKPLPLPEALRKRGLTEAWVARKISNFDYLMALNTYSGRSLNDISQYPVFPWVIADYKSPVLDLTNPATFRDLSVPMAAISPERAAQARERYNALADSESPVPNFHHGTHWLTPAAVLHYLIRVEPFTTYFLEFQGGIFDRVNRMFTSPEAAYNGAYVDPSCTKELIPEFFYLPEMFVNSNHFNFGLPVGCPATPNKLGLVEPGVGDVTLPPWANGSSHEFVRLNREALESEYVSEHLNEWIDLIWGYKQKGEAAVEACNVFYYLTYSDVVDVLAIEDPLARQSALSQKVNFGQMPEQLFKKPHPKRIGKEAALASPNTGACMAEEFTLLNSKVLSAPVACTFANKKEVVFVCDDGFYCGNSIVPLSASPSSSSSHLATSPELPLLKLEMDKVVFLPPLLSPNQAGSLVPQQKLDQLVRLPSIDGISLQEAVAYSPELKLLFVGGSWDGTVRIHNLAGRVARSVPVSSDVVTTVAYDRGFLVTGSRDCTVHIYNLSSLIKSPGLLFKFTPQTDVFSQRLRMTISGHQFPIHLVALSEDFDIVLVASHGTRPRCTVHTLRTATFLREIKVSAPVDAAFVSTEGDIVLYSSSNATLVTFSVNCEKIVSLSLPPAPRRSPPPMAVSSSGKYIAMATTETAVSVYNTHNLKLVSEFNTPETITSLAFVCSDNGIVATLENTSIVGFNLMRHGF